MHLCYRGNTYYRHKNLIKGIKDRCLPAAEQSQTEQYYLNFTPSLYQYRGVAYLKLMVQTEK